MILAIETSSKLCSVALILNNTCIAFEEETGEKFIHAEALHPMIQRMMQKAQVNMSELTAIAVGIGPGSYTGLRIGVAAAKGFAYALNLPLTAATSDQLLRASLKQESSLPVYTVVDARRTDAYVCTPNGDYSFQTVDESWRNQQETNAMLIVGDCSNKVATKAMDQQLIRYPSAKYFAELLKTNCKFVDNLTGLEPFYMKEFEPTFSKKKITDL